MTKRRELTEAGIKIKTRLMELNMTQQELADKIGMKAAYLTMIIYGERSGKKYLNDIYYCLGIKSPMSGIRAEY